MFYGWKISCICLLANFMLQGSALYGMNAFMEPLCAANAWSRDEINFSLGVAASTGQLAMPFAAAISEKYSLRALMTLAALAAALVTCAMGGTEDLKIFTMCLIVLWICTQFCGGVVANALMANWFFRQRGIAMGISNSGTNLGGLILPALCMMLIANFGIDKAYYATGMAIFCLAPAGWLFVRNKPRDLGLMPDGISRPAPAAEITTPAPGWRELIRNPVIWRIGVVFGLALMTGAGVMSQLKPRFADHGLPDATAMLLLTIAAFFGVIAKFFWGWLSDRLSPPKTCKLIMLSCCSSMALCWLPPNAFTAAFFGCSLFFSLGGLGVIMPNITAYYFGSGNFLSAYKLVSIFILLRSLGFPVMGLSWRLGSSYAFADAVFCLSLGVAALLAFGLPDSAIAPSQGFRKK